MAKEFEVKGNFEGRQIDEVVMANSKKQAKLKAGFNNGFGGNLMNSFMKSRKIKVRSA